MLNQSSTARLRFSPGDVRGLLEPLRAEVGDACRVYDFAGLVLFTEVETVQGRIESIGAGDLATVSFMGREAELPIAPDWDGNWHSWRAEYREVCPIPAEGQSVIRCPKDTWGGWVIDMPLFALTEAAQHFAAQTFDRHWYCCLRVDGLYGKVNARKRAWVRWDVCGRNWVQVGHPDILAMLESYRPR